MQVGEIRVAAGYYDGLEKALRTPAVYPGVDRDEVIETFSYDFGGGYEADIKVRNSEEGPYVDPVLFHHGCEIACGEVGDTLADEWLFEDAERGLEFHVRLTRAE